MTQKGGNLHVVKSRQSILIIQSILIDEKKISAF